MPPPVRLSLSSTDLHPVKGPGLTEKEKHHDERIRTLCFVMMACAVLYYLVLTLRDVLVPFFLALAIKYMLTPLVDLLSCRHRAGEDTAGQCTWRLHRGFAIFIAMMLAAGMLTVLGVLVVRSVAVFANNAETYSHRLAEIVEEVLPRDGLGRAAAWKARAPARRVCRRLYRARVFSICNQMSPPRK